MRHLGRRRRRDGPLFDATFPGFHVGCVVEYNFGDSEMLEAPCLVMGLGLVVQEGIRRDE